MKSATICAAAVCATALCLPLFADEPEVPYAFVEYVDGNGKYSHWQECPRVVAIAASVEGLPSVHAARGTYGAKVVDNQDGTFSVVVFPKPGLSIRLCLVK